MNANDAKQPKMKADNIQRLQDMRVVSTHGGGEKEFSANMIKGN